jgi:hypothetical protein
MISCKRAAELISLSQDAPLTRRQRVALAFHRFLCSLCRQFTRQMRLIQRAGRAAGAADPPAGEGLSDVARERIKQALERELRDGAE